MHPVEGLRGAAIVTRAGRVRLEVASGLADAVILSNDEAADTEALLRQLVPVALDDL